MTTFNPELYLEEDRELFNYIIFSLKCKCFGLVLIGIISEMTLKWLFLNETKMAQR